MTRIERNRTINSLNNKRKELERERRYYTQFETSCCNWNEMCRQKNLVESLENEVKELETRLNEN